MDVPADPPSVTEFAFARLVGPETAARGLQVTTDGHLLVAVRGEAMTRTDALILCSENLEIRPLNRRMQGRAVPEVFQRLVAAEGEGYLLLSREAETFHTLRLERDLCFFVEHVLWALDGPLMWDVGMLPGSRGSARPISLVRTAGEGVVALRVPGELLAVKVAPGRSHRVHADAFVGWVGNVVPSGDPGLPFLHFEGEGAVLVCLPRVPGSGRAS
jgi:uncharacterized protein (AIM24 family)